MLTTGGTSVGRVACKGVNKGENSGLPLLCGVLV